MELLVAPIILAVAFLIMIIVTHNGIISANNMVRRSWADVHNYERQKINMLEQLESVVKVNADYESETLKSIVALRQNISELGARELDINALKKVQDGTNQLIKGLSVTIENYPDLKANNSFVHLMNQIKGQHENAGAAIAVFNRNVEIFNTKIETIPTNLVNAFFSKKERVQEFKDSIAEQSIEYKPNL